MAPSTASRTDPASSTAAPRNSIPPPMSTAAPAVTTRPTTVIVFAVIPTASAPTHNRVEDGASGLLQPARGEGVAARDIVGPGVV